MRFRSITRISIFALLIFSNFIPAEKNGEVCQTDAVK